MNYFFRIEKKPIAQSEIEKVSNVSREDVKKCYHSIKRLVPDNIAAHPLYYVESIAGKMDL